MVGNIIPHHKPVRIFKSIHFLLFFTAAFQIFLGGKGIRYAH